VTKQLILRSTACVFTELRFVASIAVMKTQEPGLADNLDSNALSHATKDTPNPLDATKSSATSCDNLFVQCQGMDE
jgi:hypothetical protein